MMKMPSLTEEKLDAMPRERLSTYIETLNEMYDDKITIW
jgi:hypothetical protein